MTRGLKCRGFLLLTVLGSAFVPGAAQSQVASAIQVEREDGRVENLAVTSDRGYAALPLSAFRGLGWSVDTDGDDVTLSVDDLAEVRLDVGSPFFHWGGVALQLADPPFQSAGVTYLPVQLVTDFFPERMPEYYDYDPRTGRLRAGNPAAPRASDAPVAPDSRRAEDGSRGEGGETRPPVTTPAEAGAPLQVEPPPPSTYDGVRVVWIDAGPRGRGPGGCGERRPREGRGSGRVQASRRDPPGPAGDRGEDDP